MFLSRARMGALPGEDSNPRLETVQYLVLCQLIVPFRFKYVCGSGIFGITI